MTVRTTALGGSDWIDGETLSTLDFNDTMDVLASAANNAINARAIPIGTIVAWNKSMVSAYATLPPSWLECNGQLISDAGSPLNGQNTPNLNNQVFIRMASTSGNLTTVTGHTHVLSGGPYRWTSSSSFNRAAMIDGTTSSTYPQPPYIDMVFIIKVK